MGMPQARIRAITDAMDRSRYLIVVLPPRAAKSPSVGIDGHVGGIPKYPQRIQPAHPTTDAMQALVESGGDGPILMVIGQKGIVGKRRPLTLRRRLGS